MYLFVLKNYVSNKNIILKKKKKNLVEIYNIKT